MGEQASITLADRRDLVWFGALGLVCVIAGGLVAAVTGPLDLEHGSWAAAYLVLVGGVAQAGLGLGQHLLAPRRLAPWVVGVELVAWNAGGGAVIGGTLLGSPWVVDLGGLLLVAALACMIGVTRGARPHPRWSAWGFRALLAVMFVSIPIGLVLAHLRGG